ncbi:MAG: redoxin domain-containing protein [Planctomycetota bacterium]
MFRPNAIPSRCIAAFAGCLVVLGCFNAALAQSDREDEIREIRAALQNVRPMQPGVDCDTPSGDEVESCTKRWVADRSCWVFYDGAGRLLREIHYDDNNKAFQWSYFKDGIEVYRDIDTDNDTKADQHRWLGTGMRWAVDSNEDGKIDGWRMISAEETAREAFLAIKANDAQRFTRLLMTQEELRSLGLGERLTTQIEARLRKANSDFASFVRAQTQIKRDSQWVHFVSGQVAMVPSGNSGMTEDVLIHENASGSFQNGRDHQLLLLGTLIRVEDRWRLVSLPEFYEEGQPVMNGNVLYPVPDSSALAGGGGGGDEAVDTQVAELFDEFTTIEEQLQNPRLTATQTRDLYKRAGAKLLELAEASDDMESRVNWMRNYTDLIVEAFQTDRYPDGITELNDLLRQRARADESEGLDYLQWRILNASYIKRIDEGDSRERDEANDQYLDDLERYVRDFSDSEFVPEALDHIAVHYEVFERDDPDQALQWYRKLANDHPDSPFGKKARGAFTRLTSTGESISFRGNTVSGQRFDLANDKLRGKVVLIHYWETWSQVAIDEFEELERLAAKYDDLVIIGANLDDPEALTEFLRANRNVTWPQLNAPGGIQESPLAHELGPVAVPAMYLINKDGELVENDINIEDLDRAIQRLTR